MHDKHTPLKGRGTAGNPDNRFETLSFHADPDWQQSQWDAEEDQPAPQTQLLRDPSRKILTSNTSPDVGFTVSLNPYRGCEHGCVYCYARPTHEWLGFSSGLDFETKLLVKDKAPELLAKALAAASWKPQGIFLSGVTDAFQPVERQLELTRGCLRVLAEYRNPVAIVTKNALITRDIDLLAELAQYRAVLVCLSVTTLDAELARRLEPRASTPLRRLAAIRRLAEADIPTGVMVAPIIPGLTDHEIPAILNAAAEAGAQFAGHTIVRLPYRVSDVFSQWLADHYPDRKNKVLNRIRAIRNGKLNDARWKSRMRGEGIFADSIHALFTVASRKAGLNAPFPTLSAAAFRRPGQPHQLSLFSP